MLMMNVECVTLNDEFKGVLGKNCPKRHAFRSVRGYCHRQLFSDFPLPVSDLTSLIFRTNVSLIFT